MARRKVDAVNSEHSQREKGSRGCPFLLTGIVLYLQEPGRNFGGIASVAAGPQAQLEIAAPTVTLLGVRLICLPLMLVSPNASDALTVITPRALVETEATYFEGEEVCSQPQLSAVGRDPVDVCTTSVIVVRHAEAARINSDILAFLV